MYLDCESGGSGLSSVIIFFITFVNYIFGKNNKFFCQLTIYSRIICNFAAAL